MGIANGASDKEEGASLASIHRLVFCVKPSFTVVISIIIIIIIIVIMIIMVIIMVILFMIVINES